MRITIFSSDRVGVKANCSFPNKKEVTDRASLAKAVSRDHVCATYTGNYRKEDNFLESDVIPMDIDNDHSENPDDWLTEEKLKEHFGSINFILVPSRNHMKEKGGKPARPKYHVYFPVEVIKDAKFYKKIKALIQKAYPFFDDNALDAARFLFGSAVKEDDIVWNEGLMSIVDDIDTEAPANPDDDFDADFVSGVISQGNRNNSLSRFAGRVLKRYGECDKAHELFLKQAEKCDPPLEESELATIWSSAVRFYKKISADSSYVSPDKYNDEFKKGPGYLKPEDSSDVGQARVFCENYKEELVFMAATDFLRYTDKVWEENKQLAVAAAIEFLDLQLQDALDCVDIAKQMLIKAGYPKEEVNKGSKRMNIDIKPEHQGLYIKLCIAEGYEAFALKHRDYKYISAMLNIAKAMVLGNVADLDKDPNLLNTPDATYDLTKGMSGARDHDPKDLITKITLCSPGDKGEQIWKEALDKFFCKDAELIEYVQKVFGLAIIGTVYEEFLIIAYGDGANGKSTCMNTLARVLGTYSGKISSDILTMGNKVNAQPEMAELKGKRLIIASEMQEGVRLNTSMVKQLCSTDEIQACKKYKDPFHFTPSHQVVLYTNHLPRVGANDDGIWRRLKVIPFNAKITGDSDIKNYTDYLIENAGPAIMKWMVEGAEKVIKSGHKVEDPKCVKDAIEAYREENNWLGHFLEDCCDVDSSNEEKSGALYQQYRAYCVQNNEFTRSTADFYAAIEKEGFFRHKTNQGMMVKGLKLKVGSELA